MKNMKNLQKEENMQKKEAPVWAASRNFVSQITKDFMTMACIIGPIFMGLMFKFGIPYLESLLKALLNKPYVLLPYYSIFSLLLAAMTPILFTFAGVLVVLEEYDTGIAKYLFVTPVGRKGYINSRIVFPSFFGFVYGFIMLLLCDISNSTLVELLCFNTWGLSSALTSSFLVIGFAKNKMEGMALVKSCGLLLLGIPVAYFVTNSAKFIFYIVPSYWVSRFAITNNYIDFILSIAISAGFIFYFYIKFKKKLS